jgi:cell division transport system permease protein
MLSVSLNLAFGMERSTRKKILGGFPATGVVISTTLALFVLGLFGNLMIYSREFSTKVRDNLKVNIYLKNSLTETQRNQLEKTLIGKAYVSTTDQRIKFISKEEAEKDLVKQIGDFKSVLGENPLKDAFVINLKPEYQDSSSIKKVIADLESHSGILEAVYDPLLFESVNKGLPNISFYLLLISGVLLITSVILINNTLRLALFSQRFLIRSMQLVGAKKWFIQNPFLLRSIVYGILSGVIASGLIWAISDYAQKRIPEITMLHNQSEFVLMLGILILSGVIVSFVSTFFSINRYLKMSLDDLY